MSGTSADGVSLALIRAGARDLDVLAHRTYAYPAELRRRILAAGNAASPELCRLNFDLGRVFARRAAEFLRAEGVSPSTLTAVGSHGQTVVHLPDDAEPSTLQIGEPSFLAERLRVPVVSDFRPRDMAAGGQGAPLIPFLDEFLFGKGPARALQNIGGIGNVALAGRGAPPLGFDTGPGNCLIDAAISRITRGRRGYDKDGAMARRGAVDAAAAARLLSGAYFKKRPPKSLDRGSFAEEFLSRRFGRALASRPEDAVATLTYFTALTIADAYKRFVLPRVRIREAVISGGGALNPVLMDFLARLLAPVRVRSIADFGIHPLAKEPAAFALMALRAVRGRPNHSPSATGAAGARILGKISPAG